MNDLKQSPAMWELQPSYLLIVVAPLPLSKWVAVYSISIIERDEKKKNLTLVSLRSSELSRLRLVWIQVPGEMRVSQEAMIHRASSFVAPRDENHNTGPYLARSLPKHTWRHMAKHIHIHKNTDRDNNLTAKQKAECTLTTAAIRNLITVFDYFHIFVSYVMTLTRQDDALPSKCHVSEDYLCVLKWKGKKMPLL